MIYQTLQKATKARGARKIKIINLGLEPWEALAMGLEIEEGKRKTCASPPPNMCANVKTPPSGESWEEWLQTHRVELNAMTTRQFIEWLDSKLADYDKLVPLEEVLEAELEKGLEKNARAVITEHILREANIDSQVAEALTAINRPNGSVIAKGIRRMFGHSPEREWRNHIAAIVEKLTKKV